jgi:hypothetical protein
MAAQMDRTKTEWLKWTRYALEEATSTAALTR